jgi:hypothetical protein
MKERNKCDQSTRKSGCQPEGGHSSMHDGIVIIMWGNFFEIRDLTTTIIQSHCTRYINVGFCDYCTYYIPAVLTPNAKEVLCSLLTLCLPKCIQISTQGPAAQEPIPDLRPQWVKVSSSHAMALDGTNKAFGALAFGALAYPFTQHIRANSRPHSSTSFRRRLTAVPGSQDLALQWH